MAQLDIESLLVVVAEAGQAILRVYREQDFGVVTKADNSPLTLADNASHQIIVAGLRSMGDVPILSEESALPPWSTRQHWQRYWLVDPLDGTREFIKRNGEFTVNLAYVRDAEPVLGIVYVPTTDTFYYGHKGGGAFRRHGIAGPSQPIYCTPPPAVGQPWRVLSSRSHHSPHLQTFLQGLPTYQLNQVGSSLKLCMLAEGGADLCPRFGPTSEWDTAAAQAIVEAAGGLVLDWDTLLPLRYNCKESVLNPWFIACSHLSAEWSCR